MINNLDFPHTALIDAPGSWVRWARCRLGDPDRMFVRGKRKQREVAALCERCPVVLQCGADALDNRVEFGVWGGMPECERRNLIKRHPHVESWADFIAKNRRTHSRNFLDAVAG
ncbi:WhiB family transcriptional regulator [Rhodococcus maanshanensis]|uniref:Transcriptional regulator WhiB n=1 Tax=Rhodococcus maanshanensis TaxID=183556 RepID=A0A1H7LL99_9NOCA|nr:WhiB family transcriptional regulator [Rhodococcus maanshanensis]SEK99733.1 WhiB family transcriptional regulator, redox-sensing transcriptional regulator [Rhodococcus maanshanensis]